MTPNKTDYDQFLHPVDEEIVDATHTVDAHSCDIFIKTKFNSFTFYNNYEPLLNDYIGTERENTDENLKTNFIIIASRPTLSYIGPPSPTATSPKDSFIKPKSSLIINGFKKRFLHVQENLENDFRIKASDLNYSNASPQSQKLFKVHNSHKLHDFNLKYSSIQLELFPLHPFELSLHNAAHIDWQFGNQSSKMAFRLLYFPKIMIMG